jgi:hypothetical protein
MSQGGPGYTIPGLPGSSGSLPGYTGDSIQQGAQNVVDTLGPMLIDALPFVIGYFLLMWLVEYVMDHLPWSGGGKAEDPFGIIYEDNDGFIRRDGKGGLIKQTKVSR